QVALQYGEMLLERPQDIGTDLVVSGARLVDEVLRPPGAIVRQIQIARACRQRRARERDVSDRPVSQLHRDNQRPATRTVSSTWPSTRDGSAAIDFARQATKPSGRTRVAPEAEIPYCS